MSSISGRKAGSRAGAWWPPARPNRLHRSRLHIPAAISVQCSRREDPMRMRPDGNERAGRAGWLLLFVFFLPAYPALPAHPALLFAQVPFDQAIGGLSSKDPKVRLHAATLLKESAYLESAIPLAKLISDPDNAVQLEAIAAEVNIFTAGKGGPKRVGFITIEDRSHPAAQSIFDAGTLALGPAPVPPAVLLTLRLATRDDSPKVSLEAD